MGEQIKHVLARVRPIATQISQMIKSGGVTSGLTIVRYFDDEEGQTERLDTTELDDGSLLVKLSGQHQLLGWHLDLADLQLLVSLESGLGVDEYN